MAELEELSTGHSSKSKFNCITTKYKTCHQTVTRQSDRFFICLGIYSTHPYFSQIKQIVLNVPPFLKLPNALNFCQTSNENILKTGKFTLLTAFFLFSNDITTHLDSIICRILQRFLDFKAIYPWHFSHNIPHSLSPWWFLPFFDREITRNWQKISPFVYWSASLQLPPKEKPLCKFTERSYFTLGYFQIISAWFNRLGTWM